jgi:hypothetical protein
LEKKTENFIYIKLNIFLGEYYLSSILKGF